MRVYLDSCCLNRPFDDQTQPRIRQESGAVMSILGLVLRGEIDWVASTALQSEAGAAGDPERRARLLAMVEWATEWVVINERIEARAAQIMRFGLAAFDALHLACSEAGGVDVFLSTDDRLLNCAQRNRAELRVAAENPLAWFRELKV